MQLLKRLFICIGCALLLLIVGCSSETETSIKKVKTSNIKTVDREPKESELIKEIEDITIPNTIEEWKKIKPGKLSVNFDYNHETSAWPASVDEVKEGFITEMEKVLQESKDEDLVFKSLIYLLGSNINQQLLEEQITYKANFDLPYLPEPEEETVKEQKKGTPSKAIILLDASSSMILKVDGEQKMQIAKTAVRRFAKTIGAKSNVSLYVYGHAGTQEDKDKKISCSTIDEIYPMDKYEEKSFSEAVDHVQAKGWTPLANAIKKVREDTQGSSEAIIVYIVSDGAETCGGDPVQEAQKFAKDSTHKVNIIGFNVDKKSEDQLKAVAEAGNGEYLKADNPDELNQGISNKWVPPGFLDILGKQWSSPKVGTASWGPLNHVQMKFYSIDSGMFVEQIRFDSAITLLANEKMISEEQKLRLKEKLKNYEKQLKNLNKQLLNQKEKEINEDADRIDQQINDWVEQMEELKRQQEKSNN